MELVEYTPDREDAWNQFVSESKNSTFMFDRNYMEYHSDRFDDNSLVLFYKNDPIALLPANSDGKRLVSHGGLTFGGFLTSQKMKMSKMIEAFDLLEGYAREEGFETIVYKCIPHIYYHYPASSDRYALFKRNASLSRREVTTVVDVDSRPAFQKTRERTIDTANDAELTVRETEDFEAYWDILETNLTEKHDVEPVHSVDEIELLHSRFPENIRLFASFDDDQMMAGTVVYQSDHVARTQYIANSNAGRDVGALDIVFDHLVRDAPLDVQYVDFGVSTEMAGRYLNDGLIFYKEGFGGRSVVHDFYEIGV